MSLRSKLCLRVLVTADGTVAALSQALLERNSRIRMGQRIERRAFNNDASTFIKPILQYGTDAYLTQGLESVLSVLQTSGGLSPLASFVAMGLGLRLVTMPIRFYAEKLQAKRVHVVNFITQNVLKKASVTYNLKVTTNPANGQISLNTEDPDIKVKVHNLIAQQIREYSSRYGIQHSRILNLNALSSPIWFYSSFAIRNNISTGYKPMMEGFLWMPNLCDPDPYMIIPICVGLIGFINVYSQRAIFPMKSRAQNVSDVMLVCFSLLAVKMMSILPVCIPMYWLTVSTTSLMQNLLLRHPRVKKLAGINRLPSDSPTPVRDLFLLRRNYGAVPSL